MIYLFLVLIVLLQIAQLAISLDLLPKKKLVEKIVTSSFGTKIETNKEVREFHRAILCPVCGKEVTGKIIRRSDGVLGCSNCSSKLAS